MKKHFVAVLLILSALIPAMAQDRKVSSRQPWEWPDSERFSARSDDAAAAIRVRANRDSVQVNAQSQAVTNAISNPYDIIRGNREPQLFFPHELFHHMVTVAFAEDAVTRAAYRESVEKRASRLQLPRDMWAQMEPMLAPYHASRSRERELALTQPSGTQRSAELEFLAGQRCRDERAALTAAQARFGDAFNRFLYVAVAPDMFQVVLRKPGQILLRTARGECP